MGTKPDDTSNLIVQEAESQMDIVPHTRKDRWLGYVILAFVAANFLLLIINIVGAYI